MKKFNFFVVIFFIIFCFFLPAAPVYSVEAPVFYGEEVVITAARRLQFKGASPWSITVLTRDDLLRSGANNLGEALRPVLGADVKSNGYQGGLTTFRLRGSTSENVLVLVDGMRVASTLLGLADLADISVNDVERIEVVRGTSSSVYGSDAISGVVNVIRKKPSDAGELEIAAEYGSFGTTGFSFSSSGKQGIGYRFTGAVDKSDGFRDNSAYDSGNFSAGIEVELSGLEDLGISLSLYSARKELPNVPEDEGRPFSASTPGDSQTDRNMEVSVAYARDLGDGSNVELKLYQTQSYQMTHLYDFFAADFVDSTYASFTNAFEAKHAFVINEGNRLTYGLDWREEIGRSFYAGEHTINNIALYAEDELAISDKLFLSAGLREDSHSSSGDFLSSRFGVKYRLNPQIDLRGSFGTSFRSPTLNQLYWNDPVWMMYGDADLLPERAEVFDVGIAVRPFEGLEMEAGYFASTVSDMIVWHYDALSWTTTARNIDTAVVHGIEGSLAYRFSEFLRCDMNASWQNPVRAYDTREPSLAGNDLPYTPRTKGNITISAGNTGDLTFDITGSHVGARYADGANTIEIPKYFVTNVVVTKTIERATLTFKVENAFDIEYYESAGLHPVTYSNILYPMPGRKYVFGVKYIL